MLRPSRLHLMICACASAVVFTAAPVRAGELTARSGRADAQRVPIQLLAQPPALSPAELKAHEDALDMLYELRRKIYRTPPSPTAIPQTSPSGPATEILAPGTVAAPGDFTFFRNTTLTDVFTNNQTSSTNEPSLGMSCNNVLYSGNWYATLSTDYGQTFSYVNPFNYFTPLCCDQVVYYDDSRNLTLWYLQGGFTFSGNSVRLAVTDDPANITGSLWNYDFTPQDLGYSSDVNFDYPDLSTSDNRLYIMTNAFSITPMDTSFVAGIIISIPLDELAAGGGISYLWFEDDTGTIRPAHGPGTTKYFGSHPDLATVRIYEWAEGAGAINLFDRGVNLFFTGHSAPSPDGNDFMAFSDTRTLAGFVANGQIGFMWNSAQGGAYTWPNVRWARFDQGTKNLDDEGTVWHDDFAWGYPSAHPNGGGGVGGTISYGGGDLYPGAAAWIADGFNGNTMQPLENVVFAAGTDGPVRNRWGDYNTTRQNSPFGETWVGTAFVLNGGPTNTDAEPHFVWFGREEDTPDLTPSITCPDDIVVECSQHGGVPKTHPDVQAFLNGVTASAVCGGITVTNDAPMFFDVNTTTLVTFTATDDGGETNTCSANVSVVDTTPPTITYCPVDTVVECSSHCGVPKSEQAAWLGGFAATDICDASPDLTNDAPNCFPLGATLVTFTATDAEGLTAQCTATLTVVDTTPPVIVMLIDRDVLWPPNHKMAQVCATVETLTDICDPNPTFVLDEVYSDEPDDDIGDGSTTDDIQNEVLGTADLCLDLRSERMGGEDGRKYTIIYEAMDMSGNTATDTLCVRVPHDQSGNAMASMGFVADGTNWEAGSTRFALVIPTGSEFDATLLNTNRLYVGNTKGVVVPEEIRMVDVNGDGLRDLAAIYSREQVLDRGGAASFNVETGTTSGHGELDAGDRGDGPLGLHYVGTDGTDYLVRNIFDLGEPVDLPLVWFTDPVLVGAPTEEAERRVTATGLSSIHPNPFNPQTTVDYELSGAERVRIAIYDVRGSLVRMLVDEDQATGVHSAVWNGVDGSGRAVTSGIYFVRMVAGSYQEVRKIVMLK